MNRINCLYTVYIHKKSTQGVFNTLLVLCSREQFSHPAACVPQQCEPVAKPPAGADWIPPAPSSTVPHSYPLWFTVCKRPEECGQRQAGPGAAALDNFNVNFPFILCVKLVLVWRWPLALWGQVLKSDVCLTDRLESDWQCSEIDDEEGSGSRVTLQVLSQYYWGNVAWISQMEEIDTKSLNKSIVVSHTYNNIHK